MLKIQYLLLAAIVYFIIRTVLKFKKRSIHSQDLILWLVFWGAVAYVVVDPNITQKVADFLGIGRGVDLVVYVSLIFVFYILFKLLVKFKELERMITELGRHIAIKEAKNPEDKLKS